MKPEKDHKLPFGPENQNSPDVILKKKIAFLYLGTKGRLPNPQELEKEISSYPTDTL